MKKNDRQNSTRKGSAQCSRKSNRGRGGRSNNDRLDKQTIMDEDIKKSNDPNWYFTDATIMDETSKFAFNNFLGYGSGPASDIIPYAVTFRFNPAAGTPTSLLDPIELKKNGINLAALKIYTSLSSQSGKTSNYGPEDVAVLMLALGSVIEMVEWGRRALGLAFTYNQRNWNYPENIIEATGFDSSILTDLAQRRMNFNVIINLINRVSFPANVAYFAKCATMYQNIWLDSESPMAQTIIYAPNSHWVLDEQKSEKGSVLTTVKHKSVITWDEYLTMLKAQIDAILSSSTYNYIYGDVLNYAIKQNVPLIHLDLVSESYAVLPQYNVNVLNQIHNLTAFGEPYGFKLYDSETSPEADYLTTPSNDVYADASTSCVLYNPAFLAAYGGTNAFYVDSMVKDPDVATRIDMTRFAIRASGKFTKMDAQNTKSVSVYSGVALPDHYCVGFEVHTRKDDLAGVKMNVTVTDAYNWTTDSLKTYLQFVGATSAFDWFPIIYVMDSKKNTSIAMVGDVNYFTTLDADYLLPVNNLCYEGLFELR